MNNLPKLQTPAPEMMGRNLRASKESVYAFTEKMI